MCTCEGVCAHVRVCVRVCSCTCEDVCVCALRGPSAIHGCPLSLYTWGNSLTSESGWGLVECAHLDTTEVETEGDRYLHLCLCVGSNIITHTHTHTHPHLLRCELAVVYGEVQSDPGGAKRLWLGIAEVPLFSECICGHLSFP